MNDISDTLRRIATEIASYEALDVERSEAGHQQRRQALDHVANLITLARTNQTELRALAALIDNLDSLSQTSAEQERTDSSELWDIYERFRTAAPGPEPGTDPSPIGWGAHHLRFTNFDRRTIDATDAYFRANPWKGDPAHQCAKAQRWVDAVADIYGIERPSVVFTSAVDAAGLGCYLPARNQILLSKASVATLFHEFRHALQHLAPITLVASRFGDAREEEDARAWSLSLFHTIRPDRFARMVQTGRILYVPATDLVTV